MTLTETIDVHGGILVGHDGSTSAARALQTAVRCATIFGPVVHVVRAWTLATAETPAESSPGYIPSYEDFESATLAALELDVASVRADNEHVPISCIVVHGNAAKLLIEASPRAEMIVVGGRGRGGFSGLMLGSVSDKLVRHAQCRVLVERGPAPPADRERMEDALVSELKLTAD